MKLIRESACDPELLRTLFLFEHLSDGQLVSLCRHARLAEYEAGPLFHEGQPATSFFVLVDGELVVSKRAGARDVEAIHTTHRGSYCGAVAAFLDEPPERYDYLTDAATVQIEICDTGPGIPEDVRQQIFLPFYTTKAVDEGIGIGLDLAWRVIVDKHGGTLTVESNDTGTRIIARLPVNGQHS
jgi:signal transduction histidine kinase